MYRAILANFSPNCAQNRVFLPKYIQRSYFKLTQAFVVRFFALGYSFGTLRKLICYLDWQDSFKCGWSAGYPPWAAELSGVAVGFEVEGGYPADGEPSSISRPSERATGPTCGGSPGGGAGGGGSCGSGAARSQ